MCLSYTCYIITRLMYNACFIVMQYCPYCNKRPQNKRYYIPIELNRWRHKRERVHRSILLIPSNECHGYFHPKHKDANIFENHLNPAMLVFIR